MSSSASPARFPRATVPPPIRSNIPGTWAYDTMSRRVRDDILERLFKENDFEGLGAGNHLVFDSAEPRLTFQDIYIKNYPF